MKYGWLFPINGTSALMIKPILRQSRVYGRDRWTVLEQVSMVGVAVAALLLLAQRLGHKHQQQLKAKSVTHKSSPPKSSDQQSCDENRTLR